METISIIVIEIIICLIIAWALGFLAAWILFNSASKVYREEIEMLEENLSYSSACNKNQENEIIKQAFKIKEFENSLNTKKENSSERIKKEKQKRGNNGLVEIKRTQKEIEMLQNIEANLYSVKK